MPVPLRILVIDDEESIRNLLLSALKGRGYDIDLAADGSDGIAKLRTEHYDLVITDFQMPVRGGMDVAKEMHNLSLRVPVLVLTGSVLEDEERLLTLLGVDQTLHKPLALDDLFLAVETSLHQRREERREVGRLPVNDPCLLQGEDGELPGEMVRLSVKGLSLRVHDVPRLPRSGTFSLKLDFPAGEVEVKIKPKSLFHNPAGDIIVGGVFTDLPAGVRQAIRGRLTDD